MEQTTPGLIFAEINRHTGRRKYLSPPELVVRLRKLGHNASECLDEMSQGNEIESDHAWFRRVQ